MNNCVVHQAESLGGFPRKTLMLSVRAGLWELAMEKEFGLKHETLWTSLSFSEWEVKKGPVSFLVQMAQHEGSRWALKTGVSSTMLTLAAEQAPI